MVSVAREESGRRSEDALFLFVHGLCYACWVLTGAILHFAVRHRIAGTLVFPPLAGLHALPSSNGEIGAILALGLVRATFMYVILHGAFQRAKILNIAVLIFVYPLVAVTVDFLAYGKTFSMLQPGGAILIVTAASTCASGRSMRYLVKRQAGRPFSAGAPRI